MRIISILFGLFLLTSVLSSCGESNASPEEKAEIEKMDSISKAVKDSTERLEDQTKKVEDALEKLDKEFETDQTKK